MGPGGGRREAGLFFVGAGCGVWGLGFGVVVGC
jgi:hypothetical protein